MHDLDEVLENLPGLETAMADAADWLAERALIETPDLRGVLNRFGHRYQDWRGAFRGECNVADGTWWFFCPMWHGAQAVKALLNAHQVSQRASWLGAARMGGEFILRHRVSQGPDAGLLLAYEDRADKVTISALLESLDGLFQLSGYTGEAQYADSAIKALQWTCRNAWLRGEGLVRDLYDPQTRAFIDRPYPTLDGVHGRPLVDDAVWLTGYQLSGDASLREVFYEILDRLLKDEFPPGNWVNFGPCHIEAGVIHPRHAYWWGRPMLAAWRDTGEARWLDAARRAGEWYRRAQRIDGGLFRDTDLACNTRSFGQSTSGILCAAILWMDLFEATGETVWLEPIQRAFAFGMKMQLREPANPSMRGAIIEGLLEPDGTDRCPYFIRDLASIFFVQAAAKLFKACAAHHQHHGNGKTHERHATVSVARRLVRNDALTPTLSRRERE